MGKILILMAAISIFVSGCQTNMKKAFDEIKPGMDKDQVLQLIGGPRAVTRFHGKDRWFIMFYHDDLKYEREVHFHQGVVDYIGVPYEAPPEKQAALIDKQNQEANDKMFQELMESRSRIGDGMQEYEDKVKGNDKIRTVPQFEPIQ